MSFLKKHWRFTVPAIVVLCVLLLGVVALYSTSEPLEPKTVYVTPERSANPPPLNTGWEARVAPERSVEPSGAVGSPTDELVSDTESLESCCPEEPDHFTQFAPHNSDSTIVYVPDAAIVEDNKRFQAYHTAWQEWSKKKRDLEADQHAQILAADEIIRSLGDLKTAQDVIDRFTNMSPQEAAARNQFSQSWNLRNKALDRRDEELNRTKPIEPISTHTH